MRQYLLLLGLLFLPLLLHGQSGKITGTITDSETNEPLFGATVSIKGTTIGASADLDGTYPILNRVPGTSQIRFRYIG